jgi:tetratricopeptide (TPR) repeat protein
MAKDLRIIPILWICLNVLLCFLSPAVSFAAKSRAPIQPTAAQNSVEPKPPSQSEPITPEQPNSKGGEAAAIASVAKLAIDMNNETVKRIEAFYANTVQDFTYHLTIGVALIGLLGIASVSVTAGLIAKRIAKRQANRVLDPVREWHSQFSDQSKKILSDHETIKREHAALYKALQDERQDYEVLREKFRAFHKDAEGNVRGLLTSSLAYWQIMNYMQKSEEDKSKFESLREEARRFVKIVLEKANATDELVLSLTYSLNGVILYYEKKFEDALDSFRKSFEKDNENAASAFNRACCACKLADELDAKGAEKTDLLALENEAISSLLHALQLQPWRKAEAQEESKTGEMQRICEHPQFKLLIS